MKKMVVMAAVLLMSTVAVMAQTQETYPSFLNVTGKAEREVVPNQIYVNILVDEADSKGKATVAEQERKMITALRRLGIDVDKDLQVGDMSGDLQKYLIRKDKVQTSKSYVLKVNSAEQLGQVFQALGDINISKLSLNRATHSDLEKIKMELRQEAMKNAHEIAGALAGAVGQTVGKAFNIYDGNYAGGGEIYYMNTAATSRAKMDYIMEADEDSGLAFQNLKLSYSVNVKFVLE